MKSYNYGIPTDVRHDIYKCFLHLLIMTVRKYTSRIWWSSESWPLLRNRSARASRSLTAFWYSFCSFEARGLWPVSCNPWMRSFGQPSSSCCRRTYSRSVAFLIRCWTSVDFVSSKIVQYFNGRYFWRLDVSMLGSMSASNTDHWRLRTVRQVAKDSGIPEKENTTLWVSSFCHIIIIYKP